MFFNNNQTVILTNWLYTLHWNSLSQLSEVKDRRLRENVELHEVSRAHGVHQDHRGGCGAGPKVQREVRLPAGVHYERVHGTAQTLRHHESRRQPRLQRLWGGHAQGLTVKVGGVV